MILTDEIVNETIRANHKCTYLNDDYVVLYKKMEVCDSELNEYFHRIAFAHANGIHIPRVIDYRLLNNGDEKTSKGVFIEERAKGNVLNIRGIVLNREQHYDFSQVTKEYLNKVDQYLLELERRAMAPQKMYDKFLYDYVSLSRFGLRPDPNSLNYLFDSEHGFTIIDPYFSSTNDFSKEKLFDYIMNAVYGVSRPCVLIKKEKLEAFYDLPLELKLRLEQCRKIINQKISHAFEKENYSSFYIASGLENNKMRYVTTEGVFSENEIIIRLEQCFYTKGETEKTKL